MKKKNIDNMDMVLAAAVSDANVPVLILDTRWHELFPPGQKPETIALRGTAFRTFKGAGKAGK